jgi:hypothetical protein
MFLKLNLIVSLATLLCVNSQAPTIRLGKTTLVGRDVTLLKQDFFGGPSATCELTGDSQPTSGIPFAEPPLGSLRLKPPVLKLSWGPGPFNATNFGLACLQTVRLLSFFSLATPSLNPI